MFVGDYIEKLVLVRRVTKVVSEGRRFSFSTIVVVGDGEGRVGFGFKKSRELSDSIKKSSEKAKRFMVLVPLYEKRTIFYEIKCKYKSSLIFLKPLREGGGIVSSNTLKCVFEAIGIKDIYAKCIGSTNQYNIINCVVNALKSTVTPEEVLNKRRV